MNAQARHDLLQKIVNFAAPQEWCGPIFSQQPAAPALTRVLGRNYAGGIDGTLSEAVVHVSVAGRSPDLMISFREVSDTDNADLTGPNHRAFVLGSHGQQSVLNNSQPLIRPVMGVLYADTGGNTKFTSGMGTHGAVGARELHNFCAAIGPDFRRSFVDLVPSGNVDVAPTISWLLGLEMNVGPGAYPTGRVLREAVRNGASAPASSSSTASSSLQLQGMRVLTTLTFARAGDRDYLDDVNIQHIPLGRSP
jgi:hypothetical protein